MEKLELTPVELMAALGWKKSKVYYWISSGKFETISKMGIQKVLISTEDLESLKKSNDLKQFETFENSSEFSEDVSNNSNSNVTKNYKNVSNNFNMEAFALFNNSLETIKQMHQSTIINYGTTVKLLTDGQNSLEKENLELKAEKKSVEESLKRSEKEFSENLKKFEKKNNLKNIIIAFLALILAISLIGFRLVLNNLKNSQTIQDSVIENLETKPLPVQNNTVRRR